MLGSLLITILGPVEMGVVLRLRERLLSRGWALLPLLLLDTGGMVSDGERF